MNSIQKTCSGVISGDDGYCGWPTAIRTAGGEWLAVCSGKRERHICPFGRVLLYRSSDEGHSWSRAQELSCGPLDDRDAGICQTEKGTLLINYFTSLAFSFYLKPSWEKTDGTVQIPESWQQVNRKITLETLVREHGYWMRRSTDNGKTWSEKYQIPVNSPHGPARLHDGSLLFVGERRSPSFAYMTGQKPQIAAAKSCDDGLTWEVISTLPVGKGHSITGYCEPYAIEMDSGRIIATIRNHNGPGGTIQTESEDGGKTWSEPHTILTHESYPAHLLKIAGNRLVMTYGCRTKPYGIRLRISEDEAKTWSDEQILYDQGETLDLGYPTTAVMPDGSFFTVWYESVQEKGKLRFLRWKI